MARLLDWIKLCSVELHKWVVLMLHLIMRLILAQGHCGELTHSWELTLPKLQIQVLTVVTPVDHH